MGSIHSVSSELDSVLFARLLAVAFRYVSLSLASTAQHTEWQTDDIEEKRRARELW